MNLNQVINLVARQQDIPSWVVQGIAANVGLSEAIRTERRDHFPRLERRRNRVALLEALIEKGER
jgi:hypothetical protein